MVCNDLFIQPHLSAISSNLLSVDSLCPAHPLLKKADWKPD